MHESIHCILFLILYLFGFFLIFTSFSRRSEENDFDLDRKRKQFLALECRWCTDAKNINHRFLDYYIDNFPASQNEKF